MPEILQSTLPEEMRAPRPLPGVAPCAPDDWLRVDEAYGAQMAYRRRLLAEKGPAVLWCDPAARAAAEEVLEEALKIMPGLGFRVTEESITCPDGARVAIDARDPLGTLGQALQQDICILQKEGAEHLLTGAVLCFPANWRLAEKALRPLTAIHAPVPEYDGDLARRVQRLFDGVRVGRPLWRCNRLTYVDPDLHQPVRRQTEGRHRFLRSERQCILRLPRSDAVIFTIHTFVLERAAQAEVAGAAS
jgi:hypothetical protein